MKNALVILAGGKGSRFGQEIPKQFYYFNNNNIINMFLSKLDWKLFDVIVLSVNKEFRDIVKKNLKFIKYRDKIYFSTPGNTRQKSSFNALKKLEKSKITNVLIHDVARPFCSNKLIKRIINKLKKYNNAIPYIEFNDRQVTKSNKQDTKVLNLQTPQGFEYNLIYKAHKNLSKYVFSDDCGLIQKMNKKIYFIKGEKTNIKITYPEDFTYFKLFNKTIIKSGIGYDIHRIDKKSKSGLKICGIKLPYSRLVGHSDADVGLHAICDSIFGALSMRDIGYHFPNTDPKWKNTDSSKFIIFCKKQLFAKGFNIINLDINIIAEKPKINKYVSLMKEKISKLLKINKNIISIKATTNEKIGFIGNGEGIAAEAIVQISNENFN